MRCPPANKLVEEFKVDRKVANLVRRLAHAVDDGDELAAIVAKSCPETAEYVRRMHSSPYGSGMWRRTVALHAINVAMGFYGVEAITRKHDSCYGPPSHEYLNAGDTYAATLVYHRDADALRIGCWGDIVEADMEAYA
jgi:uncharacterized protein with PhoU and TrkA domain